MSHGMTAQYLNECVDKYIGLAVVDRESDTWGWVHDQHKNESGWVIGDNHDDRIQELRDGAHIKPALPAEYEKYEFLEEIAPTETYAEHPAPTSDPVNPPHYQGFSNGAEVIDITENLTFSAGNAVKYLSRAGRIDGQNKGAILEDLRKAAWYVAREIERIEAIS